MNILGLFRYIPLFDYLGLRGILGLVTLCKHGLTLRPSTKYLDKRFPNRIQLQDMLSTEHYNMGIANGSMEIMHWLYDNTIRIPDDLKIHRAFQLGYFEIVLWFDRLQVDFESEHMYWAAESGNLYMIKWLHEKLDLPISELNRNCMEIAVGCGYLNATIWFSENGYQCNTTTAISWAAINGYLNTIEWLHNNCTVFIDEWAIINASTNGHLDVIVWLYNHGFAAYYITQILVELVTYGHLAILKWFYSHGHYCNKKHADLAMKHGQSDTFSWLQNQYIKAL